MNSLIATSWSIERAGSAQPAAPTTRAGTPTTVVWAGAWATGNLRDPGRLRDDDDSDVAGSADTVEARRRAAPVA